MCLQPMWYLIVRSCRWATLTGRVRAQRLFGRGNQPQSRRTLVNNPALRKTVSGGTSAPTPLGKLKESASRFLESSLYALCGRSRIQLGPNTALSCTSELNTLSRQTFLDQQAVGPLEKSRVPWRGSVALHHKVFEYLAIYINFNFWIAP